MEKVLVIGSGASGVHFALSLLRKGYPVIMLDAGHPPSSVPKPEDTFNDLKANLSDPVEYFLGPAYEAIVYPASNREYYTKPYSFPPSKDHVFAEPHTLNLESEGFSPVLSLAQGGLAEAWTAGVYPLNDGELENFPFDYAEIAPYYAEVARRIGVTGSRDALNLFFPWHENLGDPTHLDEHSHQLLREYSRNAEQLRRQYGAYMGRSRVATLGTDLNGREGCKYCGRCLWGCPSKSLYTPSITLDECRRYSNFTYVPEMLVSHFRIDPVGKVNYAVARSLKEGRVHEFSADQFVLAAGTLSSSKIVMETAFRQTGKLIQLTGLMDNRQILLPFLNLRMIGKTFNPSSYQYHQLAIGIERAKPEDYVHGQITALKSALVHPILHNVPFDLRTSVGLFRNVRAGLGVVNLNLPDTRRETNYVALEPDPDSTRTKMIIHYAPATDEKLKIKQTIREMKKILWRLGCIVPPGMVHVRPMGSSVHYAGTLAISGERSANSVSKWCQSHDYGNLFIVDGSAIPVLPAKNITYTLMANAVRVAENAF